MADDVTTATVRELPELTTDEVRRYSRHLLLPEVGVDGQRALKAARVLCVGAGGLGSPIAGYLAAAGVGTLGIIDYDVVEYSNLQRQLLHVTSDVGRPKVDSAAESLEAVNPEVRVEKHHAALSAVNAMQLVAAYDLVVDGSDNFPTRYLVNDACVLSGRPYVYGSIFRFEGQAAVFGAPGGPCYRCLYPEPPPPDLVPSCSEGGVLGVLPGMIGTIQANEAIKLLFGIGEPLVGRLLLLDALTMRFREVRLPRDVDCPVCGNHPTIRRLQDYEAFCGLPHAPGAERGSRPDAPDFDISPVELKKALDAGRGPSLLDVRQPMEYRINRLPGARLVPLGQLPDALAELDQTADYVVYCHHGIRSVRAVEYLRGAGFRARNLAGGITAWIDQVEPGMLRY
jgi:molybdopterin/thiamine biosynthesis adenylyltransferase/rhodanese-related sulfurtransferase